MDEKTETSAELMTWPDLRSLAKPKPTHEIKIGDAPHARADLWLPEGDGPHSVVLMVHGGCWQSDIADRTLMNYAAEDLRGRGLAVWNIAYRGVDEKGGRYPGIFNDAAIATDAIRDHAVQHNLNLDKLAAFGHSAGGHLALWLAGRHTLPKASLMYSANPLPIPVVVNSGGLADLKASKPVTLDSCLSSIMDDLTGPPSTERPDVLSDTSPAEMLPFGITHISVNGDKDSIAPPELGRGYTLRAVNAGDEARYVEVPNSGHVELISPGTKAFNLEADILVVLLK